MQRLTVAQEITAAGGTATAVAVDVSDRAAIETALDEVRAVFGPVEIMVTSAGIEGFAGFLDITPEVWDRMIGGTSRAPSTACRPRCPT